jgi:myo-inositol-1(or 4)-monophosphatase
MPSTSDHRFEHLLELAHELARLSAATILPYFRTGIAADNKLGETGFDPVTAADRAAEEVIRAEIARRYPGHAILGEELGASGEGSAHTWVIDPIDGTRSFMMGLTTWGTLIGLERKGMPLLGLVNQPFTGERFWAERKTAHYDGPGGSRRLQTRPCTRLGHAIASATSPSLFSPGFEAERFAEISSLTRMFRYGGDCIAYCLLAMGQIDLVVEAGLKPYDIAALVPVIERAGGIVTTWDGGPAHRGGRIVAAGDRRVHAEALKVLAG